MVSEESGLEKKAAGALAEAIAYKWTDLVIHLPQDWKEELGDPVAGQQLSEADVLKVCTVYDIRKLVDVGYLVEEVVQEEAIDLFSLIDVNEDGTIDREEFRKAFRQGAFVVGSPRPVEPDTKAAPTEEQSPAVRQAILEVEQRIEAAQQTFRKLLKEEEVLQKENLELKEVVARARRNAERRILKKRAENVQLLADTAELESFTSQARTLNEQKSRVQPRSDEWEALKNQSNAIKQRIERSQTRPAPVPLGGTLDSPKGSVSSLEATPRIRAVEEWRPRSIP
jgi:Ca2+-binding EF-hand superfamily protein